MTNNQGVQPKAASLTKSQADMLASAVRSPFGGTCPGPHGASTARALVNKGFLHRPHSPGGFYAATDAGRAAIAESQAQ